MTSPASPDPGAGVERSAADWFARRRSGLMTLDEAREMEAWLAADADRRAALDSVELMWAAVEGIRTDPAILAIREESLKPTRRSWPVAWGGAIAACLVAVAAVVFLTVGRQPDLTPGPRTFSTGQGQTSTITLPDGSKVTLDADTVLRANETQATRRLELVRGRAFFRVAKDPSRPFVVAAKGKTITALGTAFDVRLEPKGVQVTLVEGRVKVEAAVPVGRPMGPLPQGAPAMQSTEMLPGAQLVAPDSGSWSIAKVDTIRETSWAAGQLVFAGRSLQQVAEDLNRYSDKKIVIRETSVGRATISGSFDAGDVDSFVRAVEAYDLARVATESEDQVELVAP